MTVELKLVPMLPAFMRLVIEWLIGLFPDTMTLEKMTIGE